MMNLLLLHPGSDPFALQFQICSVSLKADFPDLILQFSVVSDEIKMLRISHGRKKLELEYVFPAVPQIGFDYSLKLTTAASV